MLRLVRPGSRGGGPGEQTATWNPAVANGGLDTAALDGVTAVVHLAGAGIADKRWTEQRKAEIRGSRVDGTRALATGLAGLDSKPAVLVCGSAVGWYGDTGDREVDEATPAGSGFLADLVRDWEAAAQPARDAGIATSHLRTGIVLAPEGGTLGKLLPIFKLGLGAELGDGRQYMSWISLPDEVGTLRFLIDHPEVTGPVNGTAPQPVTNAEFTRALNEALGEPTLLRLPVPGLRLPSWLPGVPIPALHVAMGEMAGELLASARVLPHRLLEAGYAFQHADIAAGLAYATT